MKQDIRGIWIRLARIQQDISMEALCHGICAQSYLSKIENQQVAASNEILEALLAKLKVDYHHLSDDDLKQYFHLVDQESYLVHQQAKELVSQASEYRYSNLTLFYALFRQHYDEHVPNDFLDPTPYVSYMSNQEKQIYQTYLLNQRHPLDALRQQASAYLEQGRYLLAFTQWQLIYQQSTSIIRMADALGQMAVCASYLDMDYAIDLFHQTSQLDNSAFRRQWVDYNLGCLALIQGNFELAHRYLDDLNHAKDKQFILARLEGKSAACPSDEPIYQVMLKENFETSLEYGQLLQEKVGSLLWDALWKRYCVKTRQYKGIIQLLK